MPHDYFESLMLYLLAASIVAVVDTVVASTNGLFVADFFDETG